MWQKCSFIGIMQPPDLFSVDNSLYFIEEVPLLQ